MILIQILSKKSQLAQLRLAVYLNNWRQGLGAGLSYQWGNQRCLPIIVEIQFINVTLAKDVIKFQCRWLSDWVRPQKSAKLQAKIPVPQGLGWPLNLKRGYKIGRRKSDQEHKTRPSEKKQNGRWNSEHEHKWLTTSFSKQLLPQRKATFKLTFPEKIQIGKLKWIEQNNRPSAWGLTD